VSTFVELAQRPDTTKIVLLELDIGREWDFWVNYAIGVYKVNFDGIYPEIGSFTSGYETLEITRIGSVKVDGVSLAMVASPADVVANDSSFHYDGATKTLYVHCPGGDRPSIRTVFIGEAVGVTNHASPRNHWGIYGGFPYEPRLAAVPNVARTKDPTFFGKIHFEGGRATVRNDDGAFDLFAEEQDLFGNSARILLGFDDLLYGEFRPIFSGFIADVEVGPAEFSVQIKDKREQLSREIPPNTFNQTTYPDLKDGNVGRVIPLGYGTMYNVPVICTNENEAGPPAHYTFKLFDVSDHPYGIDAITAVYVNGMAKVPSATNLLLATFSLALADYDPGDEVTCYCVGFVDSLGAVISNALDVLVDLLTTYYPINFNANFFDLARWETSGAPNIGLFIGKSRKLIAVIEEICATVLGTFLVTDDGRYAHRLFNEFAPSLQTIERSELLEVPTVSYDPTEVLTSTRIGYVRDWAKDDDEDAYLVLIDTSQEDAIFRKFKTYRTRFFPTLLVNPAAAQTFSNKVLALSGDVKKTFSVRTKPQTIERMVGDMITVELKRAQADYLGDVLAEVIGVTKNIAGESVTVTLDCRLVRRVPATVYEQGVYYNSSYYGAFYFGKTQNGEVA